MAQAPGLMFVVSRPTDPSATPDELYNRFYNDEHLPDVLRHGVAKVALRYKNADPNSETQYIALYPVLDVNYLASDDLKQFVQDTKKSKTLETDDIYARIEFGLCPYKKIQTFSPNVNQSEEARRQAKTVIVVAMEPAAGQEADFEDWYRKQHLDMLSMCRGYIRCTRYMRIDGQKPTYLAIHEYSCSASEVPTDQLKIVVGTEWSKKIISEAQKMERHVFELIQEQGDLTIRL